MKKILAFLLLSYCIVAYPQTPYTLVNDIHVKPYETVDVVARAGNSILIAGILDQKERIMMLDTLGNQLWLYTDTAFSYADRYKALLVIDSFLYAYTKQYFYYKINLANGNLIWKRGITPGINYTDQRMSDYNDTSFIMTTFRPNNIGYLAFVDKRNGNILSEIPWDNLYTHPWAVDPAKNIYTANGTVIRKLSPAAGHPVLWVDTVRYLHNYYANVRVIHIDSAGVPFLISDPPNQTGCQIKRINPLNGDSVWKYNLSVNYFGPGRQMDIQFADLLDSGGFLFIAFKQFASFSYSPFVTQKIDKATGLTSWVTNTEVSGFILNESESSALSIDMDNMGNLYEVGWLKPEGGVAKTIQVVKRNSSSGAKIYDRIIDLDSTSMDWNSEALGVYVISNTPYVVGTIECIEDSALYNSQRRTYTMLARLNPQNGDTVFVRLHGTTARYPSKVIASKKYSDNAFITMSQVGLRTHIAMYDVNVNVIWEKFFWNKEVMYPTDLTIYNGKIYVACHSKHNWTRIAGTSFLLVIDSAGNTLFNPYITPYFTTGANPGDTSYSYKVFPNGANTLFTYWFLATSFPPNGMFITSFQNNTVSPPMNIPRPVNRLIDFDSSRLLMLNSIDSFCFIDKASFAVQGQGRLPRLNPFMGSSYMHQITKLSNSKVLLAGYQTFNQPLRHYAAVGLYDLSVGDTLWLSHSKVDSMNLYYRVKSLKVIYDSIGNSVYVLDQRSKGSGVRKVDVNTGQTIWERLYPGDSITIFQLNDLDYNQYYHKLVSCGYRKYVNGIDTISDIVALTFNPDGDIIDSFTLAGLTSKSNSGTGVLSMEQNGTFITGVYEDSTGLESAYIQRLGSTIFASDSVWPGDANEDGVADMRDLFAVGLAYNRTGPARTNPSVNWTPQYCNNWQDSLPIGVNTKFTDCDGNGFVNAADTAAIQINYQLVHSRSNGSTEIPSRPDIFLTFPSDTFWPGTVVTGDLQLGNATLPVNNIYGFAFNLTFDNTYIDSLLGINYGISFFNPSGDLLSISRRNPGDISSGVTSTDYVGKSGYGKVGEISFRIKDSIPLGYTPGTLFIEYVAATDVSLNSFHLNSNANTVVYANPPIISSLTPKLNDSHVFIYPNPATDELTLNFQGLQIEQLSIYNVDGSLVREIQPAINRIDVSNLPTGMYIAEVKTRDTIERLRWVKM